MEADDASSLVSSRRRIMNNIQCYDPLIRSSKRQRTHENNTTNVGRLKGVVPQQNGHWGAQIYANHQRIWLGTFKSEKEAAMAYDSAAIKLRSGDSHRNFPWTNFNIKETSFQNQYSSENVVSMIRDGSYQTRYADFVRKEGEKEIVLGGGKVGDQNVPYFSCTQLFEKELTPSDVGKLNRLVIPKKYATRYFPSSTNDHHHHHQNVGVHDQNDADGGDTELVFYDKVMKCWKFRYCYWRSSQSFVFTRGWNKFVKEKKLQEKDVVTFYACVCPDDQQQHFLLIDTTYTTNVGTTAQSFKDDDASMEQSDDQELQKELELSLGRSIRDHHLLGNERELKQQRESKNNVVEKRKNILRKSHFLKPDHVRKRIVFYPREVERIPRKVKKGLKLFGVQIIER